MSVSNPGRVNQYIQDLYEAETDEVLLRLLASAERQYIPVLLAESAKVLQTLVQAAAPDTILEIGTALGYSAQILLKNSDAKLYTIEHKPHLIEEAKTYFNDAGLLHRVTFFAGDACEIVPTLTGQFDFIFMDGPKTRYIEFLPYLKRVLSPGGMLVCDNVFFNGAVTGETEYPPHKTTIVEGLHRFCRAVARDASLTTCFLPVGDGMSVSVKRREGHHA